MSSCTGAPAGVLSSSSAKKGPKMRRASTAGRSRSTTSSALMPVVPRAEKAPEASLTTWTTPRPPAPRSDLRTNWSGRSAKVMSSRSVHTACTLGTATP